MAAGWWQAWLSASRLSLPSDSGLVAHALSHTWTDVHDDK
mgnify:CR=1 FL=1